MLLTRAQVGELLREEREACGGGRVSPRRLRMRINNPLEAVGNLLYLTKGTDGLPSAAGDYLRLAEQELERISMVHHATDVRSSIANPRFRMRLMWRRWWSRC